MSSKYELLPSEPTYDSGSESPTYPPPYESESAYLSHLDVEQEATARRPRRRREHLPAFDSDPRFRMKTPSPYIRAALLIFVVLLFWLAFVMRKALWVAGGMGMGKKEPEEVDASY